MFFVREGYDSKIHPQSVKIASLMSFPGMFGSFRTEDVRELGIDNIILTPRFAVLGDSTENGKAKS